VAYLRTYGPATLDHVHYWLGNGLSAGCKRLNDWFSGLGDRLVAVDVEGGSTSGRDPTSRSSRRPRDWPASSAATCT
jgi:Winged helix DNA-binding domain